MKFTAEVNAKEWEDALDLMLEECRAASRDASREAAETIQNETKGKLSETAHAPYTRSPSERGMPPSMITGELLESVVVDDTDPVYVDVGPTTRYGRIQELGGWMQGHPWMRWREDGRVHFSRGHSLPARPYLLPATEELVDDGTVTEIYYRHWADAQAKVTS